MYSDTRNICDTGEETDMRCRTVQVAQKTDDIVYGDTLGTVSALCDGWIVQNGLRRW